MEKQWRTIVERVDRTTGEVLTQSEVERNYLIFKKEITNDGNTRIRKITVLCEWNRQLKIDGI